MNWIKRLFSKKQEQVIEEKPVIKPSVNNDWILNELEFESSIREYRARTEATSTPISKKNKPSENYTSSPQQDEVTSILNNVSIMTSVFESSNSPSFDSSPSSNVDFGGGDFGGGGSGGNW